MRMAEETLRAAGDRARQRVRRGFKGERRRAVLLRDRLVSGQVVREGEHPPRADLTRDIRDSSRGDASFCDLQGSTEIAEPDQEGVELPEKPNLVVTAAERASE